MAVTSENRIGVLSSTTLVAIAIGVGITLLAFNRIQLYLRRKRFAQEHGCQPAMSKFPLKDPIFGLDQIREKLKAHKKNKLLELGVDQYRDFGNTFTTKVLNTALIQTIEPDNVKTILSLKFKDFGIGNREHAFGPLLGRGIFTTDGEAWAHSRAMIRPNFTRDQVADLTSFERHIETLFKLLPRDGKTVDLQDYFFKFTIDSATEFLFGHSAGSLKASLTQETTTSSADDFAEAFNLAQVAIATRARVGWARYFLRDSKGEEAIARVHRYVDQYVDEAVRYREKLDDMEKSGAHTEEKYVFLQELARQTRDKKQLRDELLNVLLAGRDTTASLLSNMWHVIARRPDIFAKLRAEVEETLNGRTPTYQELRNMKYLKYTMNESLRLHPVVPGNSRIAYHDTVLPRGGGPDGTAPLFVAEGTIVAYHTYIMHRRQDYYGADADDFRPERWEALRPGWEYLPFNGGPRICLGQQYALTEAGYVTVRLLQEFAKVEPRDSEPWMENLTLTLCSKNGVLVGLTPA